MEKYTTGTGQKIMVHDRTKCKGEHCCIHNPSDHPLKDAPTHWRSDRGIMERICEHGVGHPDHDDVAFRIRMGADPLTDSIHGCCGCCLKMSPETSEGSIEIPYYERVLIK